ncbi:hypothetical protein HDE_07735 [Halotydeus destructor]|nr:hypothetical protein HDE_07735 [Halotydeus destructor]
MAKKGISEQRTCIYSTIRFILIVALSFSFTAAIKSGYRDIKQCMTDKDDQATCDPFVIVVAISHVVLAILGLTGVIFHRYNLMLTYAILATILFFLPFIMNPASMDEAEEPSDSSDGVANLFYILLKWWLVAARFVIILLMFFMAIGSKMASKSPSVVYI